LDTVDLPHFLRQNRRDATRNAFEEAPVIRLSAAALVLSGFAASSAFAYSGSEKDAFLKADANADRKISRGEFKTLIDALAESGAPKAQSVKRWGVYGMAFKRIDANADEIITPAELEAQR
jgi:hypothetical protein